MSATEAAMRPQADLELALIGNWTVGALVNGYGSIVWCCMPRFDSTPVFDALLQCSAGVPLDSAMTVEVEGLAAPSRATTPAPR